MTTNGLQLGPSERLSEYFFQAKPSLSLSEVLKFFCAAGRSQVKKHSALVL